MLNKDDNGTPPIVANLLTGTIVSPWPPRTIQLISCDDRFVASAIKALNLALSRAPAIPTTLFFGKPEILWKAYTIASSGFETTITNASGEYFFTWFATFVIISRFFWRRSSLFMPGCLGNPAVITTTSESLISSKLDVPDSLASYPSWGSSWEISSAFPFIKFSASGISTMTISPSSFWAESSAIFPPTWPPPINDILGLDIA